MRVVKSRPQTKDRVVGRMSAAQLLALHADADRHPKALATELVLAQVAALSELAAGRAPADLADAARAELARRRDALSRLLADNPTLLRLRREEVR